MNALIITQNQKDSLRICVETLYQYGTTDSVSMIILDEACQAVDMTTPGEGEPEIVIYMPPMNPQLNMQNIIELLKSVCEILNEDITIRLLLPVAIEGETPQYSYETIFREIHRNGFVLQETKTAQYLYCEKQIVGYELTLSLRKSRCMLFLLSGNALVDYNVTQFAKAYEHLGWETVVGDLRTDTIPDLLKTGISSVFTVSNVGWLSSISADGKNVWEELNIPSINYILDHPIFFDEILKASPKQGTLVCVDQNHAKYVKKFYPNISQCHFLPLAGDNDLDGISKEWDDREIEVLYVGGYKGNLETSRLSDSEKSMLEAILRDMNSPTEVTIERECSKEHKYSTEELKEEIIRYNGLDWYIMTHIRVEALRALIRGGVKVTVFGYGWEKFEYFNDPHFIYGGEISQAECMEHMKNSKIVLNVMPWFKDGIHDRVINAMLAGAIALSDSSAFMDEHFEPGKDYVAYDICHLEQLPNLVRRILSKDNSAMRSRAYRKAKDGHRWLQRIAELDDLITY